MDGSESESTSTSLYEGLPPAPGKERTEVADSIMEPPQPMYRWPSAFDCCDRSVSVWDTLLPLAASSVGGQGLDVIAP